MFDAELYLRLVGERTLLAGSEPSGMHERSALDAAAHALVAVGAAAPEAARSVLQDYDLAAALRGDQHRLFFSAYAAGHEAAYEPATSPLPARRVILCDAEIELAAGILRVDFVSLGPQVTEIVGTLQHASSGRRRRRAHSLMMGFGGSGPPSLKLADDRGTRSTAHFSGSGSDTAWEGRFQADQPLAPDTAHLEIEGVRVELREAATSAETWIEDLPATEPAIRHLWQLVTPDGHSHHGPLIEPAIEALVAAGALAPDAPVLADVRAVAEHHGHGPMSGRSSRKLPEPWRSLQRRSGRAGGAVGHVVIGASTPVFDGYAVAVSALEASEEGWMIEAEVAPAIEPFHGPAMRSQTLAWWALDDRGNHYLGEIGNWGSDDHSGHGEIHFGAPIDRKATSIDVMPTAGTQRAVIRVPLDWGDA